MAVHLGLKLRAVRVCRPQVGSLIGGAAEARSRTNCRELLRPRLGLRRRS